MTSITDFPWTTETSKHVSYKFLIDNIYPGDINYRFPTDNIYPSFLQTTLTRRYTKIILDFPPTTHTQYVLMISIIDFSWTTHTK